MGSNGKIKRIRTLIFSLCFSLAAGGIALAQGDASAVVVADKAQEPLTPWALAVFIWLILFLTMAFVIAIGWLTRSRRS
jgi:hypothetical protein